MVYALALVNWLVAVICASDFTPPRKAKRSVSKKKYLLFIVFLIFVEMIRIKIYSMREKPIK